MSEGLRRMDDERIARLEERVNNWMSTTTDYRKSLCDKLDRVMTKIDALPCPSRIEHSKHIDFQLKSLWAITGGVVLAIIAEWVRGHGKV